MAKLDKDNPLKPIHDRVSRIGDRLNYVIAFVINGCRAVFSGLQAFVKNVKSSLALLAGKVGKSTINSLLKQADKLLSYYDALRKSATNASKQAMKVLAVIEKAAKEPEKVFKAVKSMVARLAKVFREVVSMVKTLVTLIDPIAVVLKVIDTFKMILRMVVKWITDVSPLLQGIKRLSSIVKKTAKALQAELKTTTDVVKLSQALKPA